MTCARCGKYHETNDTMQPVVTYSGKRTVWLCHDDRNCRERRVSVERKINPNLPRFEQSHSY